MRNLLMRLCKKPQYHLCRFLTKKHWEFPLWLSRLRNRCYLHEDAVWSLALISGLRIQCCCKLPCKSWMHLGSSLAVAVVKAGSCSSDSTSPGTSICLRCAHKRKTFSFLFFFLFFFWSMHPWSTNLWQRRQKYAMELWLWGRLVAAAPIQPGNFHMPQVRP